MIRTEVGIHDKFSVEIKTGFFIDNKTKDLNEFKINTWIFIPNGLGINKKTYTKDQFYRDTKQNIRLITPVYNLKEILEEGRGPFARLEKAVASLISKPEDEVITDNFSYQIRMLLCILNSALRRESETIIQNQSEAEITLLTKLFVSHVEAISVRYKAYEYLLNLEELNQTQKNYYLFGLDFLGNIIEQHIFFILKKLQKQDVYQSVKEELLNLAKDELEFKHKYKFLTLSKQDKRKNSLIISQRNVLKKFMESDLFLQVNRRKDGVWAEQMYYSIAAGLAMMVATIITNLATLRYGSFTTSLFVVLIIGYMLKDRIKDLARYYFLNSMSKKYFDTKLKLRLRGNPIGWIKESFDFVDESRTTDKVMKLRQRSPLFEEENKVYNEQLALYRKWVSLSKKEIEEYKEYRLSGVNDISRLNIMEFVKQMDNPTRRLSLLDEEHEIANVEGVRIYSLYFVLHCESDSDEYHRAYRISFNRNGITDVTELN